MTYRLQPTSTTGLWAPENAPPRFASVISGLRYDSTQFGRRLGTENVWPGHGVVQDVAAQ
jgi:hypothetical protein